MHEAFCELIAAMICCSPSNEVSEGSYLIAPNESPRTSLFWANHPHRITGSAAIVAAADSTAQYWPSPVMNATRYTGMVFAFTAVRFTAKKNSFQAKITQISAVAAMPGETRGR